MIESHDWEFPLPRTHTGMLQGNATLGAMIWGGGHVLRITLNRADFWDHRGGMPWTDSMSYTAIRRCLEAGDEAGLRQLFEQAPAQEGQPARPSRLPLGRLELDFGTGTELLKGTLNFDDGTISIVVRKGSKEHRLRLTLLMDRPALIAEIADGAAPREIRTVTAWEHVGDELAAISLGKPLPVSREGLSGWVQPRPADPPLCVGYDVRDGALVVGLTYGSDPVAAQAEAAAILAGVREAGIESLREANAGWWRQYWADVPRIDLPNANLAFIYRYGMYKFAGLTQPAGVPATLQGPWVEAYQMPPWQSDYHFNINVQECYWPAYRGNRLAHLKPLFELIASWEDRLRHNARVFLGIDDGLMLPHAVDDRCTCMGGFWSGSIDHGCTAWMAEMMYRYYRYSGDVQFLRETAYPFMVGAMRVYEEMLEERDGAFVLPVSVSPEYRGSALNAWGANASFQLACIHFLCEALLDAADVLELEPRPVWSEIKAKLPRACVMGSQPEIYLWEGTPLEESHRHHSHLAGLFPFDVIDHEDPEWTNVVQHSIRRWIREGMGMWSGWCIPWAAMLHTRLGNADAAEVLLELWQRVFTNEGHGTLHDGNVAGLTLIGCPPFGKPDTRREKMQMDAGMAATAAVLELFLHTRRGVNYLFAGAPERWRTISFSGIRTDGAFLVSAARHNGHITHVSVHSEVGGVFKLADPWGAGVREINMQPGETVELRERDPRP